ncbi:relaxase/mobilization nuclease domain-containing protein [Paraburkholderia xenovorans]|jgi:Relaxase/Mobilisation nuclease domain
MWDLVQMWRSAGRGIEETGTRREAFNLMLSMPPGTDRAAVKDAVRAFAREEFGDQRDYVFAAHDDEAHPHVHVVVLARGRDGGRLNPRKADLQRWRERFAQELRDRGIDANATPRRTRGVTQRYEQQATKHMRARGVAARERGQLPLDSAAAFDAYLPTLSAWRAVASILAASTNGGDRGMARSIANFVRRTPVMVVVRDTRNEETKPPSNARKERHLDSAPPDIEH